MSVTAAKSVAIGLLGSVEIHRADGPVTLRIAGPTLELFAYLVSFHDRTVRRDHLADLLWEDYEAERSRAALNTALWRVRQMLRDLPGVTLTSDAHSVRLDLDDRVLLDTTELRIAANEAAGAFSREHGLPVPERLRLTTVLATAEGAFLDGATSTWVLVEREDYFNLRLWGLTILMQDAGVRGDYDVALAYGRRILAADPFREAIHCQMLWLLMLSGRRAIAIQHYRSYEALLKRELGIGPMAESRAMLKLICDDGQPADTIDLFNATSLPTTEGLGQYFGDIDRARRSVYRAMVASNP